ncbi:hypothetical protein Syun_009270 [Stephania yunnanensis]|uniref:CCHC-type domain-containing protein n=1 Tax=Stephania yunnanensis TaxID=152371 RepID=A0AAP0KE50_9MAGN
MRCTSWCGAEAMETQTPMTARNQYIYREKNLASHMQLKNFPFPLSPLEPFTPIGYSVVCQWSHRPPIGLASGLVGCAHWWKPRRVSEAKVKSTKASPYIPVVSSISTYKKYVTPKRHAKPKPPSSSYYKRYDKHKSFSKRKRFVKPEPKDSPSSSKKSNVCYNCGKPEHYANKCHLKTFK